MPRICPRPFAATWTPLVALLVACSGSGDDDAPPDGGTAGSNSGGIGTGGLGAAAGDAGDSGDAGSGASSGASSGGHETGGQAGSDDGGKGGAGAQGCGAVGGTAGSVSSGGSVSGTGAGGVVAGAGGVVAGAGGVVAGAGGAGAGALGGAGSGGTTGCEEYPNGAPGPGCACVRVSPDGDDAAAVSDGAATPFRNVQPAIEFASAHPGVPSSVCVAQGSACGQSAEYLGPSTGFALRDGVSVYGDYESSGWTRCALGVTRLRASTATGVSADVDVESATLDGFSLLPADVDGARAITVNGAGDVALTDVEIDTLPNALDFVAIDVSGGAVARLHAVDVLPPSIASRGVTVGVRVVDSRLIANEVGVSQDGDPEARLVALWMERAGESVVSSSGFSTRGGRAVVAASIIGGDALDVTRSSFVALEGSAETARALVLRDGATVTLSDSRALVEDTTDVLAIDVLGARVTMHGASSASGAVLLDDAPGSLVKGVFGGGGSFGAAVMVRGDATGVLISDVFASGNGPDVVGIRFEDCRGAAPRVTGTIVMTGNGDRVAAVRSRGNCHPIIEDSTITTSGHFSEVVRGVRCDAEGGVPSACTVIGSTFRTELFPAVGQLGLGHHYAIGVSCSGGSCASVADNHFEFDQVRGVCGRSCTAHAYGVATDATVPLANNVVVTSIMGEPRSTLCPNPPLTGPEASVPCWDTAVQLFNYSPCDSGYVSDGDFEVFGGCVVP